MQSDPIKHLPTDNTKVSPNDKKIVDRVFTQPKSKSKTAFRLGAVAGLLMLFAKFNIYRQHVEKSSSGILPVVLRNAAAQIDCYDTNVHPNSCQFQQVFFLKENELFLVIARMKTQMDSEELHDIKLQELDDLATGESVQSVWERNVFSKVRRSMKEQDQFLTNPYEIEEGVLQCAKCKSSRTLSYAKQVRSADEGTTIFAECIACGHRWNM